MVNIVFWFLIIFPLYYVYMNFSLYKTDNIEFHFYANILAFFYGIVLGIFYKVVKEKRK